MALSLEDVQEIKFGMTERAGYNVVDVDDFVDQVEASVAELHNENANLTRQVEGLPTNGADHTSGGMAVSRENADSGVITVTTSSEASAAVTRLVQMSTEHAESVVAEAEAEAARIRAEADQSAKQLTDDATARAERVESDARTNAEQVRAQAQDDADQLDQQTERRRQDLMSQLESERDQLAESVAGLRAHEDHFRQALTDELRGYIDALSGGSSEPSPAPAVLAHARPAGEQTPESGDTAAADQPETDATDGASAAAGAASDADGDSTTPRLDALLGEDSSAHAS